MQIIISIIIVNYNVKQLVINCLNSIFRSIDNGKIEVILIDNASEDGSVNEIREKFPQVKILQNVINKGFPVANNQGFEVAKGRYVMMLNPDTEIMNNALTLMTQYLDEHFDISLVGPKLLNSNGMLQYSAWRFPSVWYITAELFYMNRLIGNKYYLDKNLDLPFEVDSVSGAAMMFRRELLEEVGCLNESLFWIEDVDFCYRLKAKGRKVFYLPTAKIIHHSGQSARKNYKISVSNQVFNKIKFYKEHHSFTETYIVMFISFTSSVIKLILFFLLSPFKDVFKKKAKAYIFTLPRIFCPPKTI